MDLINPRLTSYAEDHTSPESTDLRRINRDTHANVLLPRMLSGHLQGRLLAMISRMLQPNRILEIGTFTGYSALCLAEGLRPGGRLVTIDCNAELERKVKKTFLDAGLSEKITFILGDATQVINSLEGKFDLVFIDADKENYSMYFDLVFDKVSAGGFILADNVLWSGKVVEDKPDKDTRAIMAFNRKVQSDARVENVLLPVRDGIMIIRKR